MKSALSFPKATHALLLANGEPPSRAIFSNYLVQAQKFFAIDGAAKWALDNNFIPDLVIGDLDSITENGGTICHPSVSCGPAAVPVNKSNKYFYSLSKNHQKISLLHTPNQDHNDLYKTLGHCLREGFSSVTILGAFGKRVDHFLSNIHAISCFFGKLNMMLADDNQLAFFCPLDRSMIVDDMQGSYLSLYPLEEKVGPVSLSGTEYDFNELMLSNNGLIGTLNKIRSSKAVLSCKRGKLLVMMPQIKLPHNFKSCGGV